MSLLRLVQSKSRIIMLDLKTMIALATLIKTLNHAPSQAVAPQPYLSSVLLNDKRFNDSALRPHFTPQKLYVEEGIPNDLSGTHVRKHDVCVEP